MKGYVVIIHYVNGSADHHLFSSYLDAADFCRAGISYTGDRVRRVEITEGKSVRAMWDISWTDESKAAGLRRTP